MIENPNTPKYPNTVERTDLNTKIDSIKHAARRALGIAALTLPVTACGPGSTFQMDKDAEVELDAGQDAPLDTTPDTPETNNDSDIKDSNDEDHHEAEASTPKCPGVEITFHDMPGYEIYHTDSTCTPLTYTGSYTIPPYNNTWEDTSTENPPRTICMYPGDKLIVYTYYNSMGITNDLNFSTNIPFNPGPVKRSGTNLNKRTINQMLLNDLCNSELETPVHCMPEQVENTNTANQEFTYKGLPGCDFSGEINDVANCFYFAN